MNLKKNADRLLSQQSIERHKHGEGVIQLCVSPVCGCGISLRSAIEAIRLFNRFLHPGMEEIPSHSSLRNRMEKSGLYTCNHSEPKETEVAYGAVIDESMQAGSRKILLSLGMGAGKENGVPLRMSEVEIPDISVEKNRNGSLICGRLKAVTEKTGNAPAYVISDSASIMNKGIRESSPVHLRDAGHNWPCF